MDSTLFDLIKKITIIAMVSDDYLMETLVLKGGNAIDLVYQLSGRASIDLDFSMDSAFNRTELTQIRNTIEKTLSEAFKDEGYVVFDVKLTEKPKGIGEFDEMEFWGGYQIEFKLIPKTFYSNNAEDFDTIRRNATVIGPNDKRVFKIDISKFEYCASKVAKDIDGYTVYVYSTEMLILEKIRAICQQTQHYRQIVKSHEPVPRARDFYDIYIINQTFPIDMKSERTKDLLKSIFEVKKVPLSTITDIATHKDLHRADFDSLKDTVRIGTDLKQFDFYFDYVLDLLQQMDS